MATLEEPRPNNKPFAEKIQKLKKILIELFGTVKWKEEWRLEDQQVIELSAKNLLITANLAKATMLVSNYANVKDYTEGLRSNTTSRCYAFNQEGDLDSSKTRTI